MIIDEIKAIISVQLGIPDIDPKALIIQDLGAESADIVGIVAALEDKYGIRIDEEELAGIHTAVDFSTLVKKKL